jgi:DNA polymerase III delta subunit
MQIYILHGEDNFRKELALSKLRQDLLEPELTSLNLSLLDKPDLDNLFMTINRPAFGPGNRLVIVKNAKFLDQKSEDNEVEKIIINLKNLPGRVIVIFDSDKINGTIKIVKALKQLETASIEEFKNFSPWDSGIKEAAKWLIDISSTKFSKRLNHHSAEFFVEYIGAEDSLRLYSELERLYTLGKEITEDLIRQECTAKPDVFKFIKEAAANNTAKASEELKKIIDKGEANIGLLMLLESSTAKYLKLKYAISEGLNKDEQAKLLGISPQRLYYMQKEVSAMDTAKLERLSLAILDAERKVKTGQAPIERSLRVLAVEC